jgi:hypothetical protein
MRIPLFIRRGLPLLAAASLFPLSLTAGTTTRGRGKPTVKAFDAIEESTITAVNGTSITVSHPELTKALHPVAHGKGTPVSTTGKPKPKSNGKKSETKTYEINNFTDIEVDGQKTDVNALKVGMAVQISADPPLTVTADADGTDGGTARTILAHEAPPKPSPTPAAKKKK